MKDDSPRLGRCFESPPVIAYKRSKNLRDMLVRAKLSTKRKSKRRIAGYRYCGGMCVTCALSEKTSFHKNNKTGEKWKIHSLLDCKSSNVVYKISCRKCPTFTYIGETSGQFSTRVREHKGYITQKKVDHPIGKHFNTSGHSVADMLPIAIEQVLPKGDTLKRRRRERLWITRYDSIECGANSKFWHFWLLHFMQNADFIKKLTLWMVCFKTSTVRDWGWGFITTLHTLVLWYTETL